MFKVNVRHGNYHTRHHNYKQVKGYSSRKSDPKIGITINYLRFKYHLSMNTIAKILGVSTRTVHRKISFSRLITGIGFDGANRRRRHEVKIRNTKGELYTLKRLVFCVAAYLAGWFNSIYEALGDEPP